MNKAFRDKNECNHKMITNKQNKSVPQVIKQSVWSTIQFSFMSPIKMNGKSTLVQYLLMAVG